MEVVCGGGVYLVEWSGSSVWKWSVFGGSGVEEVCGGGMYWGSGVEVVCGGGVYLGTVEWK